MPQWPRRADRNKFWGNPASNNAQWQRENLVQVDVPWAMFYDGKRVPRVRIHRKAAGSLQKVLNAAWAAIGRNQKIAHDNGWAIYNGSYAYRNVRGRSGLSNHAYGAALDFDAGRNALGSNPRDKIGFEPDDPLVLAFKKEGWRWGGDYAGRTDPMHFEAERG